MMNSIQILLFGTVCVFLSLTAEVSPTKQADDQETEKTPPQNSSTKEMPLPNNFAEYDSNGDGLIHYEEFTHAVLSLHPLSDMDNLRPLFQTWDTNGDEKIDMEEFNASPLAAEAEQTGKARRCRLRCYLRCFLFLCAITCRITS